jgi:hypothetical protein
MVSAGSIDNLDYKDKPCLLCGDNNRQVDDHDVIIDADTLNGQTNQDIVDDANDYTNDAVGDEASARQTADNNEANARSGADTTERNARIAADNTERNQRIGSDIALGIGIAIVDHNSRDRDSDLQDNIDETNDVLRIEGNERQAADEGLQEDINGVDTNSQGRDTTINQYISDNQDKWSEDKGGMSRNALAHYLTGLWNMEWIFQDHMNYYEWLKGFFVQKDTYTNKIAELELKIDQLEADVLKLQEATGTKPADKFEVGMVTSDRTGEIIPVDGYTCDGTMKECVKIIGVESSTPENTTATEAADAQEAENKRLATLEWHTRICERLHTKWHCDARDEMLAAQG